MIRRIGGFPCPSLTLAFTPGTRSDLHPLQVNRLIDGSSLILKRSISLLARADCAFARAKSDPARIIDDSIRRPTMAEALSLVALRFTGKGIDKKELTIPPSGFSVLIHLIFAETALELVPMELWKSASAISEARRRGIDSSRILLDRSIHHAAMLRLAENEKRGRPDLVHVSLLSITGTPLFMTGQVRVYVHTNQNVILEVKEGTRIPKNYLRFRGLAEKVLAEEPSEGLVKMYRASLTELVRRMIEPDLVVGLSTQGATTPTEQLARTIVGAERPCLMIGGFPHGHFDPATLRLVDKLVRIDKMPLEAHVIAARVIYEIEKIVRNQ